MWNLRSISCLLLLCCSAAFVSAQRSDNATSKWLTLTGDAPKVIARGGFSGLMPDSSFNAYILAKAISVADWVAWCDVQLTKDGVGICLSDIRLDNSSDVNVLFKNKQNTYLVNGVPQKGWFSVDFNFKDLALVSLKQGVFSRSPRFDGTPQQILTVQDVASQVKPPGLWLNIQHDSFYSQRNLSIRSFVVSLSRSVIVNYISSPEVNFLRSIARRFNPRVTKFVFRFLGEDGIEPSTNQTYGSLLKNLTFVKTFASGILVPKHYIWPVDNSLYLQPHTSVVLDAHKEGLEIFAADFANDVPSAYNYSYDPVAEYLSYIDNGDFSVDGVLSDFPLTPSSSVDCFSHLGKNDKPQVKLQIITSEGASGDYPGCTDLAYTKAASDGADVLGCPVQMTKDRVPFCLGSINLIDKTTAAQSPFSNIATTVPELKITNGILTINLTWTEIQSLKPAISNRWSEFRLFRNPKARNDGNFMSLADFLTFAKNATSVSGVMISVENAAYMAKQGLGVTGAVLDALSKAGYNNQTAKKVLIQSTDSSVLEEFKKSSYELVYGVGDDIRDIESSTILEIKTFAKSVIITKQSVFPSEDAFIIAQTNVVQKLQSSNLTVYVQLEVVMISCNQNLQYLLINILVLYAFYFGLCIGICNITSTQYLRDPATLWCPGNIFKLGFFNPQNSSYRYVGIWYNFSETTVVWVANRDKPLKDSSGVVKISEDGNLVVMNGDKQTLWSSNISSTSNTTNSTAQLQGGNLVLLDNSNGSIIWQSYQHPSDTFLPKMKIPINSEKTREKTGLRSWKSPLDPNFGDFSSSITTILPQLFIWKGKYPLWRSGQWNGQIFIGVKNMRSVHTGGYNVVDDEEGTVYLTGLADRKEAVRFTLEPNGNLVQSNWDENERNWKIPWLAISDDCDVYGTCGPFGCCNSLDSPICSCLRGFDPKSREEWEKGNWSSGCARRKPLQCEEKNKTSKEDGFVKMEFMKVPDFAEWLPPKMEDECRSQCLKNFSCLAYAFDAGIGCMSWSRSLIDIQELQRAGTTLYIRVAYSELDHPRVIRLVAVLVIVSFLIVCVGVFLCLFWISRRRSKIWFQFKRNHQLHGKKISLEENITTKVDLDDLSMFKFEVLAMSTDQFHENNKLGQGGFGPVYKGILADGKEIAVKRLSTASGQGMKEFMNEVLLISTVQHRNLVKLLGCCIEKEEKMLIYEYLPNKSLDVFLFDPTHKRILDLSKRLHIIEGIGRGLLYLHRDSRIKIIHRDLKPSNILLDNDFNPKISDFGMARIFKCNQDQAETRKVAGTYGYMAPEYAIKGRFSEKSDVFSFGVLLLEIMCGQKVASFWNEDIPLSLLGYAWELWKENNTSKFIDPVIWDPDFEVVLKRCIHIGLLCVQEFARDRPTISTVLSMLSSEVTSLPAPLQPAFANFFEDNGGSVNYVTLTNLDGR